MGASSRPSPAFGMGDLPNMSRESNTEIATLAAPLATTTAANVQVENDLSQVEEDFMGASLHPSPAIGMGNLLNENHERFSNDENLPTLGRPKDSEDEENSELNQDRCASLERPLLLPAELYSHPGCPQLVGRCQK